MSHADGLFILPNGKKYHFEYDGTADICCTRLYARKEELYANWRGDNLRHCVCEEKKPVKGILSTAYGHWDFLWESEACLTCMCITGKTHDWEY